MLERDFKRKVKEDFEKMGWVFIQLVAGSGVPHGMPDTLCLSPTGYHCFVEWKKEAFAKHQPLQGHWNAKLNNMGHDTWFVYPEGLETWKDEVISKSRKLSGEPR